jgi:serine protease AprX
MKRTPFSRAIIFFLVINLSLIPAIAGVNFRPGDGVTFTGASGVTFTGASGVTFTGASGQTLMRSTGVTFTGASGVTFTGASGVTFTGASEEQSYIPPKVGIAGFDLDLALLLDKLPDTSVVSVVLSYYQTPTQLDFDQLKEIGVLGGTRFNKLPMVVVNATKNQIQALSKFPSIRSIYWNKTLRWLTHESVPFVGASRVPVDPNLTALNGNRAITGSGVTIAVLDTGIDTFHPDLPSGSKVIGNVAVVDTAGTNAVFGYPITLEGLRNSDEIGHGTFVAAIAAGSGTASQGYYKGVAPGASILGVSVGNANMFFVLSGLDYILSNSDRYKIKVANCSFSADTLYDANDPINIATRVVHDSGISVVFSAGNRGPGPDTLNPYAVAPWVIGVASGKKNGDLSDFSSRGGFLYNQLHPTLTAPGEAIVSARSTFYQLSSLLPSGPSGSDSSISSSNRLFYTSASGTSFSAPHVAGTIALMLQANPNLTPDAIKTLLQLTASPMLDHSLAEVGAGYLNSYAAVCAARVPTLPYGLFRANLEAAPINFIADSVVEYQSIAPATGKVRVPVVIPGGTLEATIELGWRDTRAVSNDLALDLRDPNGTLMGSSNQINGLGLFAQRESISLKEPQAGTWTVEISNSLGFLDPIFATDQPFAVAVETTRVEVTVQDLNTVPASTLDAIRKVIGRLLMSANGGSFRPTESASRLDFARSLMLAAGPLIPQYAAFSPSFTDVPVSDEGYLFVESVANSPNGNLLNLSGGPFQPKAKITRLTAAIAYVKALGLANQALTAQNPGLSDWNLLPPETRGYASLAVQLGIIKPVDGAFGASKTITLSELAEQLLKFQSY